MNGFHSVKSKMKSKWQLFTLTTCAWLGYITTGSISATPVIFPQLTLLFLRLPPPETIGFFPTRTKRLTHTVSHPNALFIALNIAQINLFPGDKVVIRTPSDGDDSVEGSSIILTRSNQSEILDRINSSRRSAKVWDHPLFVMGNTVIIEYFPAFYSQRIAMFGQKQREDALLIITSYTFGLEADDVDTPSEGNEIKVIQESILDGVNEAKEAICYKKSHPKIYQKARAVARLYLQKENSVQVSSRMLQTQDQEDIENEKTTWYFCTGWLVGSANHLLTNYHCVFDRMSLLSSSDGDISSGGGQFVNQTLEVQVNFMAETSSCEDQGTVGQKKGKIEATNATIVAYNENLDYALLSLHPARAGTNLSKKYGFLTLRAKGPKSQEDIYIPQHPRGEPKEIAAYKNGEPAQIWVSTSIPHNNSDTVSPTNIGQEVTVYYNADTQPGSSGSPVLSRSDHTVVALHHAGGGGGLLGFGGRTRLGGVPTGNDPIAGSSNDVNYGLRIDSIIRDLKAKGVLPPCAVAFSSKNRTSSTKCLPTRKKKRPSSGKS